VNRHFLDVFSEQFDRCETLKDDIILVFLDSMRISKPRPFLCALIYIYLGHRGESILTKHQNIDFYHCRFPSFRGRARATGRAAYEV
jgi:hypothetical protein